MADMRARAVIEAVDRTGKTFDQIAGKMKAVDKAAAALGKAKGVKGKAEQVDAVAKSLTKVSAIDAFRGSQASLAAARTTFREAQANVSRLAAEMSKVAAPTAALSREFTKARRRSDIVRFGPTMVVNNCLSFTQVKNAGRKPIRLVIPIKPELQAVLDATKLGTSTFLTTDFGKPFTANGFGNWFRQRCNEAGLAHWPS